MIERASYYQNQDKPLAYNPFLDRDAYVRASEAERVSLNPYTRKQLETHIGERFNVLLSTVRYEIKNGQLYPERMDEPAIEMFKRGVGREGSSYVDLKREEAEVLGFSTISADLASPQAKIGDKRLSISPPGGSYQHNFYDIFTLKADEKGKYVETRRYSSGLTIEETVQMLKNAGAVDESYQASPEYSLSHPIKIEANSIKFKAPDSIHQYLHKNHEYTSQEDLAEIIKICTPLITSYINSLADNPLDTGIVLLTYNAMLKQAEIAYDALKINDQRFLRGLILKSQFSLPTKEEVFILGTQPVRQAMIGCGFSASFKVPGMENINSPFSVADKDPKKSSEKQILCCTCPFCNKEVEAEIGGGKITCPECKKSASWSN